MGRIVHQKGLDLAIRALSGLQDMDWSWRIAGDGPQLSTLETRSPGTQHGRAVCSSLAGRRRSQLRKEYAASNLFLFPSRHEGMPNAVLEAMASGLPVIATRIAGNEELVVDGETGILVPVEDATASERGAAGTAGRRATSANAWAGRPARELNKQYGWQRAATQYLSILEKASR